MRTFTKLYSICRDLVLTWHHRQIYIKWLSFSTTCKLCVNLASYFLCAVFTIISIVGRLLGIPLVVKDCATKFPTRLRAEPSLEYTAQLLKKVYAIMQKETTLNGLMPKYILNRIDSQMINKYFFLAWMIVQELIKLKLKLTRFKSLCLSRKHFGSFSTVRLNVMASINALLLANLLAGRVL